jgi:hypothetical protein
MEIIKETAFVHNGTEYLARTYCNGNNSFIYGEIIDKKTKKRPYNMKGIVREYLQPFGIPISTDANVINTHDAVKTLIQHLEAR